MCFVCGKMHIFCSIGIFIYQIHKLQMFAQMNDAQNTFMQSEKNGMDTKEKQIINWWTAQIFVYPSISTYAHRSNNLYLFYFIFFFISCVIRLRSPRLFSWELFYLAVYVIYKFYFNNRHSINFGLMFVRHDRHGQKKAKPNRTVPSGGSNHQKDILFRLNSLVQKFNKKIPERKWKKNSELNDFLRYVMNFSLFLILRKKMPLWNSVENRQLDKARIILFVCSAARQPIWTCLLFEWASIIYHIYRWFASIRLTRSIRFDLKAHCEKFLILMNLIANNSSENLCESQQ